MTSRPAEQTSQEPSGIPMFSLYFCAPVIGILKRWPNTLHAVDLDGLTMDPDGTAKSVCGLKGLRVVVSGTTIGLWPPAVKGLAPQVRCRACFDICKKKRPRSRFIQKHMQGMAS